MHIGDLYINTKNVTTSIPFCLMNEGLTGLQINGTRYSIVSFEPGNEEQAQKALDKVKEIQEQLVTEVEGKKGKKK